MAGSPLRVMLGSSRDKGLHMLLLAAAAANELYDVGASPQYTFNAQVTKIFKEFENEMKDLEES